jgi:uncharacterized protein YbjT (DUF2867 family)
LGLSIARPVKVLVTGGTGLVGNAVLRQALEHPETSRVVSLGRRRTNLDSPKLTEVVVDDFLDLAPVKSHLHGIGLCLHCLAAYSNRMDRAAYERITVGYLDMLIRSLEVASPRAAFCLFSAEGARRDGKSWLRAFNVKGRAEQCLLEAQFPRKYIFRPAYIHPTRPRAHPVFYDPIMKPVFRLFPAIGIESAGLARAMIETGLNDPRPEAVLENREMRAFQS